MSNDHERVDWTDVVPAAEFAFNLWSGKPELRWAQEAWLVLTKAGMTEFSTELERYEVSIKFLALCDIYLDFCYLAWNENVGSEYYDWADALGLTSSFRLGQLVGAGEQFNDHFDEDKIRSAALEWLAERARKEVVEALEAGFGDRPMLFLSLWQSNIPTRAQFVAEGEDAEDYEGRFELTSSEVLNMVTEEKLRAFAWLDEGAPTCRP